MEFIEPYKITVLVLGLSGLTFFIQLVVLDVVGFKNNHTPGHPIPASHNELLFRASRALSNSNESVAIFILFVAFSILSSANPQWLNTSALVYLFARIAHMLFYYFNLKLLRSISFAVSLFGLMAIFIVGVLAWL
ncbi:MAPEG family protein [Sinobacterium caligoides]|uniref:MAPEG family protein n=1 Tax=Sinobacterium caligoides TaxID=933926 RepID=A0A3N2DQY3_9GAMM|nr:MAPEG family protein [Sinobacterium caligoides]ROS01705.1 MAPEG family protein [Sinobacterium caligoides]